MDGIVLSYYVLGWLLSVIAILGNGLVIYLITTRRQLYTSANGFIASLCAADFMVGFTLFPPLFACDIWSLYDARITTPLRWFFLHVSITNICAMAAERYFAIVLPLKYVTSMTWRRVFFYVFLSWAIPIVAFLIPFTILFIDKRRAALQEFFIFVVVVLEFLPMILLGFMTVRILLITQRLSGQIDAQVSQVRFNHVSQCRTYPSKRSNLHRYSARVIVLVVSLFFLCYTIDIYFIFCDTFKVCTFPSRMRYAKHLLLMTNSAVNPLAYAFFKKDIRKQMQAFLFFQRTP